MSICVLCNRTFGSDEALKQHEANSPKHAPLNCKACNRSFGSQAALNQHQKDSPVHQKPRKDSFTVDVTPVSSNQNVPLPSSTSPNVRSTTHMPSRRQEPRSFTFSELHERVAEAVAPDITSTWYNPNMKAHPEDKYTTSVMGKFTCGNRKCEKRQWSSKVVAIRIQKYPRSGYNAVVYNQHCNSCQQLGSFKLNKESYVERIAYRLKVWAGVRVEAPPSSGSSRGPHESALCEGCKVDDCPWTKSLLWEQPFYHSNE